MILHSFEVMTTNMTELKYSTLLLNLTASYLYQKCRSRPKKVMTTNMTELKYSDATSKFDDVLSLSKVS